MKVGLMQPYLFPYIGYFQLIAISDRFVIHDDVQYIRQGWINRNHILHHNRKAWFVFSVRHAQYSKNINERFYTEAFVAEAQQLLRKIDQSYSKAPYFKEVQALLARVLESPERNVSRLNTESLGLICQYLGINTPILVSSQLGFDKSLVGQERVIAINQELGATHYINPIGGMDLYSVKAFRQQDIQLSFLRSKLSPYAQLGAEFVPGLSIIDVMMHCSCDGLREMLGDFELVVKT